MEGLLSGRVDVNDVVVSLVELALVRPPPEVGGCIWRNQGLDVALEHVLLFEAIVDKKRKKEKNSQPSYSYQVRSRPGDRKASNSRLLHGVELGVGVDAHLDAGNDA